MTNVSAATMILHHPLRPDGRPCGHYWQATRSTAARCPACGGDRGIEVTDMQTLPVAEPVWRRTNEGRET